MGRNNPFGQPVLGMSWGLRQCCYCLALVVGLLTVSCGQPSDDPRLADKDWFSVVPVLAESDPPCEEAGTTPELRNGDVAGCLRLGSPLASADGVHSADITARHAAVDLIALTDIVVRLTESATRGVREVLATGSGTRVALVARGAVLTTLSIQDLEADGRIHITGLPDFIATELVEAFGGDPFKLPHDYAERDRRARRACDEHPPPAAKDKELLTSMPRTAGEITALARDELGTALPPWDALPPEHLVASCSYGLGPEFRADPKTTTCPDGTPYSLDKPDQYFVDEDGRYSQDELSRELLERASAPC